MIERIIDYNDIIAFIDSKFNIFLFGNGMDDRDKYLKDIYIKRFPEKSLVFNYDVNKESYTINNDNIEYNIKKDLFTLMDMYKGDNLFIDISCIPVPLIFCLMKEIKNTKTSGYVFCAYTKPEDYVKEQYGTYELSDEGAGIKPIPGFLRSDKKRREKYLIMFLGYEGNRAKFIYDEEQPDQYHTIPILSLPGYQPTWHDTAFEMNIEVIRSTGSDMINYIAADSPFEAYNLLKRIRVNCKDAYLIIAPVGIKIHALGAALFSLDYPDDCNITYDNPIEKNNRSTGIDYCQVFDITSFFIKS